MLLLQAFGKPYPASVCNPLILKPLVPHNPPFGKQEIPESQAKLRSLRNFPARLAAFHASAISFVSMATKLGQRYSLDGFWLRGCSAVEEYGFVVPLEARL